MNTIYRERFHALDPRLRRHVHHDDRSRQYAFDTAGLAIKSAVHARHVDILDQGAVGSCTAEAGIGCLATDPHYAGVTALTSPAYTLDQPGAYRLYSDEGVADGGGPYPPSDLGSSGLTCAKTLHAAGMISGYQHTFNLDDALRALTVTPILLGISWTQAMSTPDKDGRLHPIGAVAGGHEVLAREIDAERERVWIDNSWSTSWGLTGRGYLTFDDLGALLDQQGDVTILTPLTAPAPTPAPTADRLADVTLAAALRRHGWVTLPHVGDNQHTAAAGRDWLAAKGL